MRWRKSSTSTSEPAPPDGDEPAVASEDSPGGDDGWDPSAPDGDPGEPGPRHDRPDVPVDLGTVDGESLDRAVRRAVARALAEDLGDHGDVTSLATVPPGVTGTARIVARAEGIVCGVDVVRTVFAHVDARIAVEVHVSDGDAVGAGTAIATATGPLRSILTAERSALNFLARLSGVATLTRRFVDAVEGTGAIVRDTRKTTPGLRLLEKHAVKVGGGANHRIGLYDALLIKENHIAAAGSVTAAVEAALQRADGRHVQVEVDSFEQLEEALKAGATDILLDNFTPEQVRQAVQRVAGRASLEVSGNLTLETVRRYATTGVHRLAVGQLTHSAPALDVALDVQQEQLERPDWASFDVWGSGDDAPAPREVTAGAAEELEEHPPLEEQPPSVDEDPAAALEEQRQEEQVPSAQEDAGSADGARTDEEPDEQAGSGFVPETAEDDTVADTGELQEEVDGLFAWRERKLNDGEQG